MSLTDLLIPTYRQMLRTLAGLLDKARQQMPEQVEALLSARLAADMYPLSAQVRFAAFRRRRRYSGCAVRLCRSGWMRSRLKGAMRGSRRD